MKTQKLINCYLMLFLLLFGFINNSCKKQGKDSTVIKGNIGTTISNTFDVITEFDKKYYLSSSQNKTNTAVVNVKIFYKNTTNPLNIGNVTYYLYRDSNYEKLIKQETLAIQNGEINFDLNMDLFTEGKLDFYLGLVFDDNSLIKTTLSTYKVSEFHPFSVLFDEKASVTFLVCCSYDYKTPPRKEAHFSNLPVPAGTYNLHYLTVWTSIGLSIKPSKGLEITVDEQGNASKEITYGYQLGNFYFKFALLYNGNYIWFDGPQMQLNPNKKM